MTADISLSSYYHGAEVRYLVSDFREGGVVLHVPPLVDIGLLLDVSELLLGPPQSVGQRLELSEPAQQLPPHLLPLPLQAHLHLPCLILCHLQLQAVTLRFQTSLMDLHREVKSIVDTTQQKQLISVVFP